MTKNQEELRTGLAILKCSVKANDDIHQAMDDFGLVDTRVRDSMAQAVFRTLGYAEAELLREMNND